jgi:hypothetical protein
MTTTGACGRASEREKPVTIPAFAGTCFSWKRSGLNISAEITQASHMSWRLTVKDANAKVSWSGWVPSFDAAI